MDRRFLPVAIAVACMVVGCSRVEDQIRMRDGVAYGVTEQPFRQRWWHYYERGLSYAAGGFLAEAEADFRLCMARRLTDARRARTYGMHFTQCFVHRELAAVLMETGREAEAELLLRRSMAEEPSAKALHLLRRLEARNAAAEADDSLRMTILAADTTIEPEPQPVPALATAPRLRLQTETMADGRMSISGAVVQDAGSQLTLVDENGSTAVETDASGAFTVTVSGEAHIELTSADAAAVVIPLAAPIAAPSLALIGVDDELAVNGSTLWLQIDARSGAGLSSVVCFDAAGQERARLPLDAQVYHGPWSLPLNTGRQDLRLVLSDVDGRSTEQQVSVTAQPGPDQRRELRAAALLLPPSTPVGSESIAPLEAALYQEYMVADGRFRYRDGQADDLLQRELELVDAGYIDRSTAARGGRRLQARYVLASTLRRNGQEMECFLRLIHAESRAVVASADLYAPTRTMDERRACYQALAGMLRQIFPVLGGSISGDGSDDGWLLDLGAETGASMHLRFHRIEQSRLTAADGTVVAVDSRPLGSGDIYRLEPQRAWLRLQQGTLDDGAVVSE